MNINSPILTKKSWGTNIALGLAAAFSVAAIGLAGTTHAQGERQGGDPTNGAPTSKEDCKHDGWKAYGFKNQGECVSWVNAHGYGGNQGKDTSKAKSDAWWNFDISGDNNIVNIVINYIFG